MLCVTFVWLIMAPIVWRHFAVCPTFTLGVRFYTDFLVFPVPNDNYFLWEFVSRAVAVDLADRNDVSRPAVIDDGIATGGGGSMLLSRLGASSWYMWRPLGLPIDPPPPTCTFSATAGVTMGSPNGQAIRSQCQLTLWCYKGLLMWFPNRYT